jgi:ATP-binding cassette subfamily C protein CydD
MTKNRTSKTLGNTPINRLPYILHGASTLLWIPQAALLAYAIDHLVTTQTNAIPLSWSLIVKIACAILVLGIAKSTLEAWGARRIYINARQTLTQLRNDTIAQLVQQSPLDKSRPASGAVASMMAEQAESIVPWLTRYQSAQWRVMTVPIIIAIVVASLSWVAALILLISAPLIPLFMAIVGWRAQAASEKHMVEMGQMNGYLLDRLRGLSTLRAMNAIASTLSHVRLHGENLKDRTMAVLRIAFLSSAVLELFSALGVAMVAVYVGFHYLGNLPFGTWGGPLTMAQGFFILLLSPAFFEPLRELSAAWHDRATGLAAINNITQLKQTQVTIVPDITPNPATPIQTTSFDQAPTALAVNITGLTVGLDGNTTIFNDFNLHIAAGEHVAITGTSGSGKSVLLAAIAGLITPQAGSITLNDIPMDERHAAQLRQQMAWMGQRPHIFTGSLRTNLLAHDTQYDGLSLESLLKTTRMNTVIDQLPVSILGEGGLGLSGGEVVRLALLRLALHEHAGLIILDEPTAHLDAETASLVIKAIRIIAEKKTLIIATHDPVLIAQMGRTISINPSTNTEQCR